MSLAERIPRRRIAGFTLVELLIVFTLLVTLTAILVPVLMPSPARALRESASQISTQLRETRRLAQARQARKRFVVDTRAKRFTIDGSGTWRALPDEIGVTLTTGRSLLTGETQGGIDFFPDGSSSGGRVSLSLAERTLDVDIEWLTGRIRVAEVVQ